MGTDCDNFGSMEIALVVAALLVGALSSWIIVRSRPHASVQNEGRLIAEQEKNKSLAATIDEMRRSLELERNKILELTNDLAATEANFRNLEERLAESGDMQEKFTAQFKNLANDIFEEKTKKFTEQ